MSKGLPASTGLMMETFWSRRIHVVAVTMLRCVHVPKFHDPIAQIPGHETEGWLERVDQPPFP